MPHCPSSCTGSTSELLTSILEVNVAIQTRVSQLVQAFEVSSGASQSDQGDLVSPDNVCSQSDAGLLEAILNQRIAIF